MATTRPGIAALALVLTLVLTLGGAACEGKRTQVVVENDGGGAAPGLVSVVRMNDPNASAQLLSGFYGIEDNAWRWTAERFSAVLRTPPGAAQSGATLTLSFSIPDGNIEKLGNVTLSASVNGAALKAVKYDKPGAETYSADIPAALLAGDSAKIDFALDKSVPPGVDKRQLGIVASYVGLFPK